MTTPPTSGLQAAGTTPSSTASPGAGAAPLSGAAPSHGAVNAPSSGPLETHTEEQKLLIQPELEGQETEGEKTNGEGKVADGAVGEKDDACRDLVLVEDPEAIAFENPEKDAAAAVLQEEMKALLASIPEGAGAAFTAMQLQELEQQSRVYQYMAARVPVPTHLVFPIWKSVTGASSEGAQKYPTLLGLATLCLDFGKNPEPEPGRCRRTDGKKWRCWRSTIPNEKYCERHMHRGRKRPIQLVVEDDEPDSASGSKSSAGKATEGAKKTDDKSSSSKKLSVAAPAAVEST